jgi:hypothetical protein
MTAPTTRTEGAADGLREAVLLAVATEMGFHVSLPYPSKVTDAAIAAVPAYDAAHPPQLAPQPVPVVATGAADGEHDIQTRARCQVCGWDADHIRQRMPKCPGAPAAQATVPAGGGHAAIIESMRAIAREHGWALAVHGTLVRDIDLIAVPWVEEAAPWTTVYEDWIAKLPLRDVEGEHRKRAAPGRPHCRRSMLILQSGTVRVEDGNPKGTWNPPALDVSFMPRAADSAAELTRLGYGLGGGLSDGARQTILLALNNEYVRLGLINVSTYITMMIDIRSARAELERLP